MAFCAAATVAAPGQQLPAAERTEAVGQSQPQTPPVSIFEARELLMRGSYDQAAEAFSQLSKVELTKVAARLGLAECRLQVGEYRQALDGLLAEKAKDSADWYYLLAQTHRHLGTYASAVEAARSAIRLNKDHAGARRILGELLEVLGRRDEAIEVYRWFDRQLVERAELPQDAAWITHAAVGFVRYSVLTQTHVATRTTHALQEMLQRAYGRLDRIYWPARIAAAELLREKFNNDEDDGSVSDYRAAMRINPNLPQAHVGLGEVALERWGFEEVEIRAKRALQINPNDAPAIHLLAKKLILERRYEQAAKMCDRALAINPNDLTAMSIAAAAAACMNDQTTIERLRVRVSAVDANCATFHRMMADALAGIRQYAASQREYLAAIQRDPTDANARTELGMMYMQWGDEDKAREALGAAWALDPYNQRTKFTLELLDRLHKFASFETDHFIVRHNDERDPGLGPYVASYLEPIYEAVTADFGTHLTDKTIIEFFPTHRAFGVRITGKPWIHTVGACTGRVIALATPRESAELTGRYNLSRVLKHEFTHTVTLAATNNRIPHWFTEGLAVYQEDAPRSFDWMQILVDAVRGDRLFTLESINWGFMRPKRPTDRQMAYAQSEWMCEYIIDRFGYDVIDAMLKRFRDGFTQARVFVECLGVEPDAFDADFSNWASAQAQRWGFDVTPSEDVRELRALAAKDDVSAAVLGRLARAELDEVDYERALGAARRALELDENEKNALTVFVKVLSVVNAEKLSAAAEQAVEDEMLPSIERLSKIDPNSWTAAKALAELRLRREEFDKAVEALKRLQHLCPMDPLSWRGLAGIYLSRNEEDRALPQLLELARIEQNDAAVPGRVAAIVRRRGDLREAAHWYRQALAIDPFDVSLHRDLGDVNLQVGANEEALREYRMLTLIEPDNAKHFEAAALAASKLGDDAQTQTFVRRALELNPSSSVRSLLRP